MYFINDKHNSMLSVAKLRLILYTLPVPPTQVGLKQVDLKTAKIITFA